MSIRVAPGADICSDRQPGGTGFICTLEPDHGGMHEARAVGGQRLYAQWSTGLPRPQVRLTNEAMAAFLRAKNESPAGAGTSYVDGLRAFLEALGIEVIE